MPEPKPANFDEPKHIAKSAGSFFWELIKVVLIAAMIIIPIRYFLAQPFEVKGASMEQSFSDGNYLVIDEISYRFKEIERGDVIVFRYPGNPREYYIKRVIGLPGETVKIQNGDVFVCNQQFPDCFKLDETNYLKPRERTPGNKVFEVDPDNFFVLGDNRSASSDSRSWGELPRQDIVGKVLLRVFPDFGFIPTPPYN
jgi:signal peptidase I